MHKIGFAFLIIALAGCAAPTERYHIARPELLAPRSGEAPRPVLVVDIDDTVVDGGQWNSTRLLLNLGSSGVAPFPGAVETLQRLDRYWHVVFLTARDDFFEERTLLWLDRQGFPRTPVIFSSRVLPGARSKIEYKVAAVAELIRRGLNVRYGVGDKASDIVAYSANGVPSTLIVDGPWDRDLSRTVEALDVETWPAPEGSTSSLERIIFSTENAWGRIATTLAVREESHSARGTKLSAASTPGETRSMSNTTASRRTH